MQRLILILLLIFTLVTPIEAYNYSSSNGNNDRYYLALTERFPKYRKVIDKLYNGYSGWIIPLAERHGIAPLIALSEVDANKVELMIPVMYKYSDVFMDIYNKLGEAVHREQDRARIAFSLLYAFSLGDENQQAQYQNMLERAKYEDTLASSFRGAEANHYAKRILDSKVMPENFIEKLKNNPEEYQTLLQELSKTDAEVLAACGHYPNAISFLLNTGKEGLRLIESTDGQIVMLSWFLSDDEQRKLPAYFRQYHKLSEALKYCGADAYFTIMVNPDMFFLLFSRLRGDIAERYLMSYAVLFCQTGEGDIDAVNFFKSLSKDKSRRLAYAATELMNLPDKAEDEENGVNMGNTLAPITETFFFRFVDRYGDLAIDACKNFSSIVDISRLMMETWNGDKQDITPLLEAIKDYRDMGLQAAIYFRNNTETQQFLLNYPLSSQRTTLIMFWLYDALSKNQYTENIGGREDQAKAMLDRYEPDYDAGLPVSKKNGLSIIEFIPGYDVVAPIANWIKYGQTPTIGEYFFAAMDLVQVLPIATAGANVIKGIATGQTKRVLGRARRIVMKSTMSAWKNTKSVTKAAWGAVASLPDIMVDGAKAIGKFTIDSMQSSIADIAKKTGKRLVALVSHFSLPTLDDFADFTKSIYNRAKVIGVNTVKFVLDKPGEYKRYLTGLSSASAGKATGVLVEKTIQEMALQPTVFYMGTNSLLNHLRRR